MKLIPVIPKGVAISRSYNHNCKSKPFESKIPVKLKLEKYFNF